MNACGFEGYYCGIRVPHESHMRVEDLSALAADEGPEDQ